MGIVCLQKSVLVAHDQPGALDMLLISFESYLSCLFMTLLYEST